VVVVGATAVVVTRSTGSDPEDARSTEGAPDDGGPSGAAGGWVVQEVGNDPFAANDTTVCTAALRAVLYCVDARTGDELFSQQLDNGPPDSAVLLEDRLLVSNPGAPTGELDAFSLEGERLWRTPLGVSARQQLPVVDGVVTVVDSEEGPAELVGVDVADGRERWRAFTGGYERPHVDSPRVFTDGVRVYTGVERIDPIEAAVVGNIAAVDPASGETLWTSPQLDDIGRGDGIAAAAPFDDGSAVAFLMDGRPRRIVVLDAATGQLRWEVPVAFGRADIVHADGTTVVSDGPDMRAHDAEGRQLWEAPSPVFERSPGPVERDELVFDDGRLFLVGFDVYEVDPATGASRLVHERPGASDAAVVGDHLVIAGVTELEAVPLASIGR
jgi:outer membrane protein assembly factor BamB